MRLRTASDLPAALVQNQERRSPRKPYVRKSKRGLSESTWISALPCAFTIP